MATAEMLSNPVYMRMLQQQADQNAWQNMWKQGSELAQQHPLTTLGQTLGTYFFGWPWGKNEGIADYNRRMKAMQENSNPQNYDTSQLMSPNKWNTSVPYQPPIVYEDSNGNAVDIASLREQGKTLSPVQPNPANNPVQTPTNINSVNSISPAVVDRVFKNLTGNNVKGWVSNVMNGYSPQQPPSNNFDNFNLQNYPKQFGQSQQNSWENKLLEKYQLPATWKEYQNNQQKLVYNPFQIG